MSNSSKILLLVFLALTACSGSSTSSSAVPQPTPTPLPVTPTVAGAYSGFSFGSVGIYQMVDGPDGRIWFSEFSGNNVGAMTTAGTASIYPTSPTAQPNGITVGSDSNIWTGGYGGTIFKVTTAGVATAYPIAGSHIGMMILGTGGNVWFTDYGNNAVGYITPAGAVTEYPLPAASSPSGIAKGSDGNYWVLGNGPTVYKVSPAGAVLASYTAGMTAGASLTGMVAAPDGNMYFGEYLASGTLSDKIARVTTAGTITELGVLMPGTYPNNFAVGKDSNVYFSEYNRTNLGKINTVSGAVSETPLSLTSDAAMSGIVNGPDNRLYLGAGYTIYAVAY